jgi:hypothetical protein
MNNDNILQQTANAILMVRPVDFEYNAQTAVDNEFMRYKEGVTDMALMEFDQSVDILRNAGVQVVVLDGQKVNEPAMLVDQKTPDAVFCNNWIGTTRDSKLIVYTMATANRRAETKRLRHVKKLLDREGFYIGETVVLQHYMDGLENDVQPEHVLEGTGAFVIDHLSGIVYAAKSCRCSPKALKQFMQIRKDDLKEAIMFETKSSNNKEIYHANVMLSIGSKFVVVCSDSIVDVPNESHCLSRQQVLKKLSKNRTIISISHEQAEKYFCANILEVRNDKNEPLIVMSTSAYNGFNLEQRNQLSQFGKLVPIPIDNAIEYVGGGSARCMLAEIFLPKRTEVVTELTLEAMFWLSMIQQQNGSQQTLFPDQFTSTFEVVYENMLSV